MFLKSRTKAGLQTLPQLVEPTVPAIELWIHNELKRDQWMYIIITDTNTQAFPTEYQLDPTSARTNTVRSLAEHVHDLYWQRILHVTPKAEWTPQHHQALQGMHDRGRYTFEEQEQQANDVRNILGATRQWSRTVPAPQKQALRPAPRTLQPAGEDEANALHAALAELAQANGTITAAESEITLQPNMSTDAWGALMTAWHPRLPNEARRRLKRRHPILRKFFDKLVTQHAPWPPNK